jgi:hypothetical protein
MDISARLREVAAETGTDIADIVHQHAMEGLLRRVFVTPGAETFALRGSVLTRAWVYPAFRPAGDLDFVSPRAYDENEAYWFIRIAAEVTEIEDGIKFASTDLQIRPTWYNTDFPGLRLGISYTLDKQQRYLEIDIGFGDPLTSPPDWRELPAVAPEVGPVYAFAIPPELGLAWKVHGLCEFDQWRPKDLWDIYLMSQHTTIDWSLFEASLIVAFTSRNTPLAWLRRLEKKSFFREHGQERIWLTFRYDRSDPAIPKDCRPIVRAVAKYLKPSLDAVLESAGV